MTTIFTAYPSKLKDLVIFSDCQSVLQAAEHQDIKIRPIKSLLWKINSFLNTFAVKLTLQWIPSHNNIEGNIKADILAKQGATYTQPDTPASYDTAKQIIKTNTKEEWLNSWALGTTGRCVFPHMPKPDDNDAINSLQRQDQVTIFRLRTGHIHLNSHLNRIKPDKAATCPLCNHQKETVAHHLFDCTALQDIRNVYLPRTPNVSNTLYSNSEQLKKTCKFFTIASGRRASAQMAAGSG